MFNPLDGATLPTSAESGTAAAKKPPRRQTRVVASANAGEHSPAGSSSPLGQPPIASPPQSSASTSKAAADESSSPPGGQDDKNILEKAMGSIGEIGDSVGSTFKKMGRAIISIGKSKKAEGDDDQPPAGSMSPQSTADAAKKDKKEKKLRTEAEEQEKKEKKEKREKKAQAAVLAALATTQPQAPKDTSRSLTTDVAHSAGSVPDASTPSYSGTRPPKSGAFGGGGAAVGPRHSPSSSNQGHANFDEADDLPSSSTRRHVDPNVVQVRCKFLCYNNYGASAAFVLFYSCSLPVDIGLGGLKSAIVALTDDEMGLVAKMGSTAAAASASLRGLEGRISQLQAITIFNMTIDDAQTVFLANSGRDDQLTQKVLADQRFAHVLPAFLCNASSPQRLGSGRGAVTITDATSTYCVGVCELREGEMLDTSAVEVRPRTRQLILSTPTGINERTSRGDEPKVASGRSQLVQTSLTLSSMEGQEREIREAFAKESQTTRAAHQQEVQSLTQQVHGLELDLQRRVAEIRDLEKGHREQAKRMQDEMERLKRDVLERTAFIMKLKKTTNPAAALTDPSPLGPSGGVQHSSTAAAAEAVSAESHGGGALLPPAEVSTVGQSSGVGSAHDALLKVRQSIAEGEKFIEGMRRRAASPPAILSSPPHSSRPAANQQVHYGSGGTPLVDDRNVGPRRATVRTPPVF